MIYLYHHILSTFIMNRISSYGLRSVYGPSTVRLRSVYVPGLSVDPAKMISTSSSMGVLFRMESNLS